MTVWLTVETPKGVTGNRIERGNIKMKYSQEYIEYVKKYPFMVIANYLNGIKD